MNIYSRRQVAVMAYAAGLLTGMVVAFASCSPAELPVESGVVVVGGR